MGDPLSPPVGGGIGWERGVVSDVVFHFHLSVLSVRLPSRSRTASTSAATSEGTAHETSATTAASASKHGTHHHATHHCASVVVVGLVILPDNGVSAMGAEQGLSD